QSTEIDPREVVISFARAGGPGGQHVNKTSSAVRAHHGPSGLRVHVTSERSQRANVRLALQRLGSLLHEREEERAARARASRHERAQRVERGNATHLCAMRGTVLEQTCDQT